MNNDMRDEFESYVKKLTTAICKDIYNFTTNSIGEFVFTIFGTPNYQSSHFIGYSIIIFTYRAQQKYEEYFKTIYR